MRLTLVLKFLSGILFLQTAGVGFCYLVMEYGSDNKQLLAVVVFLDLLLLIWSAFRFSGAAREYNYSAVKALQEEHAKEREKIRVNAERQKIRLVNKNHKQILKETRRAHTAANFKIGAILAGFFTLGGIMLYSQFITIGLLALTTGGGGLAGYLVRLKQEKISQNREKKGLLTGRPPANRSIEKIS